LLARPLQNLGLVLVWPAIQVQLLVSTAWGASHYGGGRRRAAGVQRVHGGGLRAAGGGKGMTALGFEAQRSMKHFTRRSGAQT
jgi:hypothetical protein